MIKKTLCNSLYLHRTILFYYKKNQALSDFYLEREKTATKQANNKNKDKGQQNLFLYMYI